MKYLFFLFLYIPVLQASYAEIQSDTVSYKENALILQGNVFIEHSMGIIHGDCAHIDSLPFKEKMHCKKAILEGNISFQIISGKTLFCDKAIFDFVNKEAYLYANHDKVCFQDSTNLLSLWGKELSCRWDKDTNEIQAIHFLGDTSLNYASEIHLVTDGEIFWDQEEQACMIINGEKPLRATYKDISICSHAAFISLKGNKSQNITFAENVSFQKDSLLLSAAKMCYCPDNKSVEVVSSKEKKIILTDLEHTFSITGERMLLYKNSETHQGEFETSGLVEIQCSMDNKEEILEHVQEWIKNLF